MPPGVLLHVIEAARPVDLAPDPRADVERAIDQVPDRVVLVDDLQPRPDPRDVRYRTAARQTSGRTRCDSVTP